MAFQYEHSPSLRSDYTQPITDEDIDYIIEWINSCFYFYKLYSMDEIESLY